MDEPLSPLHPMKCIKTYSKASTGYLKLQAKSENEFTHEPPVSKKVINEENEGLKSTSKNAQNSTKKGPLTTKNAVKMLLEDTLKDQVCRYCLNVGDNLSNVDELITIGTRGGVYSIALKEMIASFHPIRVDTNPHFPSKICPKCLDRTINSYLFSQQCDQSERALRDCFEDIFEKVQKLDPLERTTKRGRQKLKPNYNIINTDHKYVIDYAEPTMHLRSTINHCPDEPKIQDLECLKCSQVLPDIVTLLNHVKIHPKSTWFNCRLCGKSFPKLCHLKKHFRHDHNTKTNNNNQDDFSTFNCNECGVSNSNYQEFLQHIEKHKFKTTLEHVLTCDMDKLCTICFEKGSNMVSVKKVVNLHGGFEELTGEKTVESMVAAALPEKHYKYQELYVAKQATVLTLRKKDYSKKSSDFIFTSPFIIYKGNMNKYANAFDDYIFMFNEPQKSFEEIALKEPEAKKIKYDDKSLKIVEHLDKTCINNESSEISSLEYENFKENYKHDTSEEIYMKSEYVFKFGHPILDVDPFFNKDKTKTPTIDKDTVILIEESQIIGNVDRDDNTPPPPNSQTLTNVDNCEIYNKEKENQKSDEEKIDQDTITIEEKIKLEMNGNENISKEKDIISKNITIDIKDNEEKPWQCAACLTNNKPDRDICFCCEAKTYYNDLTKFNFKPSSSFSNEEIPFHVLKQNACANTLKFKEENSTIDLNTSVQITHENNKALNEEKAFHQKDMEMETEISNTNVINMNQTNKIIGREFDVIKAQISHDSENVEAMDIEENPINQIGNNMTTPVQNMSHFINPNKNETWNNTSLQFNIGTGSVDKGRKYRRPLRNVARAFHK